MKNKGFTIVEISVALGIIILISLVSLPLLVNYQKTTKLKSEARLLATNLRLAQQLAITEQKIYNLELFTLTNKYRLVNSETAKVAREVTLNPEVSISVISGFTNDAVRFNAIGGVIEAGSITLRNTRNETSILQIKPSGYVEITD